jgi:hypothetical protein
MLLLTFSAPAESRAAAAACSTQGLITRASAGGYKVVRITAEGLSCTKARAVARAVAQQVIHRKAVSVPGVLGFGIATQTCTGCAPTTEISLTYSSDGKLTVSLRGCPCAARAAESPSLAVAETHPFPRIGNRHDHRLAVAHRP